MIKIIIFAIFVFLAFKAITNIYKNPDSHFWDFKVYYFASKVLMSGGNPYTSGALSTAAGSEITLKYVYPPATAFLFAPFTALNFQNAAMLFYIIKLIFFAGLFLIWFKYFDVDYKDPVFFLYAYFAFGSCIYIDLMTGNVSVFEQVLLWTGFAAFIKKKDWAFYGLITLVSFFKIVPLLFLLLPLIRKDRGAIKKILICFAAFAAYACLQMLFMRGLFADFIANAVSVDERGAINPCSLAYFKDIAGSLSARTGGVITPVFFWMPLYAIFASGAVYLLLTKMKKEKIDGKELIFAATLLYTIIAPRMKDYSYILIIPSVYYMFGNYSRNATVFLLLLVSFNNTTIPYVRDKIWPSYSAYYPFFLATIIFFVWAASRVFTRVSSAQQQKARSKQLP